METKPQTTALALPMAFQPQNLDQALQLATKLADSHLLPKALQKQPSDVLVILMAGHEYGLSPMQSIQAIDCIEGRPSMRAEMIVALCLKHPSVCESFLLLESTEKKATYEAKRAGCKPVQMSFTIEQAQRANLLNKDNWRKYPEAMLRARASSALARAVFPDLTRGVYASEEMADAPYEREINPAPAPAPAAPTTKPTPAKSTRPAKAAAKKPEPEDAQVEQPSEPPPPADAKPFDPATGVETESAPDADGKELNVDEAIAEMKERISAVTTPDALKALVPAIEKLPPEAREALKAPYGEKSNELKKA